MPDETPKTPPPAPEPTEAKEAAAPAAGAQAEAPKAEAAAKPAPAAAAKPAAPAAAKPAAAAPAKPAAPKPPAVMQFTPWDSQIATTLKQRFGSGVREAGTYVGQNFLTIDRSVVLQALTILRDDFAFDYLVDVTAVHYPKKEQQFELVWILYSYARNERLRVRTTISDGEPASSVVSLWPTANWLEREVFDMFGIEFAGHPDLRRILLPEDWKGFPLRKEHGIAQQDTEWVKANIGIESGQ